jgi:hypothetical protein
MLLTIGPATTNNLDPETVNNHFDIIAFQIYYSNSLPGQFINYSIKPDKFAFGAKFEGSFQTAKDAFAGMHNYGFKAVII